MRDRQINEACRFLIEQIVLSNPTRTDSHHQGLTGLKCDIDL